MASYNPFALLSECHVVKKIELPKSLETASTKIANDPYSKSVSKKENSSMNKRKSSGDGEQSCSGNLKTEQQQLGRREAENRRGESRRLSSTVSERQNTSDNNENEKRRTSNQREDQSNEHRKSGPSQRISSKRIDSNEKRFPRASPRNGPRHSEGEQANAASSNELNADMPLPAKETSMAHLRKHYDRNVEKNDRRSRGGQGSGIKDNEKRHGARNGDWGKVMDATVIPASNAISINSPVELEEESKEQQQQKPALLTLAQYKAMHITVKPEALEVVRELNNDSQFQVIKKRPQNQSDIEFHRQKKDKDKEQVVKKEGKKERVTVPMVFSTTERSGKQKKRSPEEVSTPDIGDLNAFPTL